jgi:hypothetical protein
MHPTDVVMLHTILMTVMFVWMVGLELQFGERVLPLLLVVAAMTVVMDHIFCRRSLKYARQPIKARRRNESA